VSHPPYESLNLAAHVGDDLPAVLANRQRVCRAYAIPEPCWLRQVHGTTVVDTSVCEPETEGDGSVSRSPNRACVVLTADCLPVLLCDRDGTVVCALHAGWRGLANGVVEAGVRAMNLPADQLMAWLGPAIGPEAFEVGAEVRTRFVDELPTADSAFRPIAQNKYLANLYGLARQHLERLGIRAVYGGNFCTVREAERFFSYRRDGITGRMASLIWISR